MLLPQPWVKVLSTADKKGSRRLVSGHRTSSSKSLLYWEVSLLIFYYYNRITKTAIAKTTKKSLFKFSLVEVGNSRSGSPVL